VNRYHVFMRPTATASGAKPVERYGATIATDNPAELVERLSAACFGTYTFRATRAR
jgi:hypothetical protein